MWTLGEIITLPSGRRVALKIATDPGRPWTPLQLSSFWHVVRGQAGASSQSVSFYFGEAALPLQLDEQDAQALAEALNFVVELE